MPSIHHIRRPRASPLWQIVHLAWEDFLAGYENRHRRTMGPLRPEAVATVRAFVRCGDLAAGFTRFHCPDCGHEKLLAFTCKARHFCPACHQRRVRQTGQWIAASVCHDVPHRQFVFTFPKMLRGIFRKRRHLLHLLFQTATECLRDAFRTRLGLPEGRIAAAAAVHTFGDYLVFHPHLHLFVADLLAWKHSGFHIDGGENPVGPGDTKGRQRLAEYLLRAPFSLQKIHWNPKTSTVIYRSRRSWRTKRNFEVFTATDFLAAAIDHIPPRGQQTIRYYGLYSNKSRGLPLRSIFYRICVGRCRLWAAGLEIGRAPPYPCFSLQQFRGCYHSGIGDSIHSVAKSSQSLP
jgi:hypothetical protein